MKPDPGLLFAMGGALLVCALVTFLCATLVP